MKITLDDLSDPLSPHFRKIYAVTVDGFEVKDCVEADDQAGYALKQRRDSAGALVIDRQKAIIETERVHGLIHITQRPGLRVEVDPPGEAVGGA